MNILNKVGYSPIAPDDSRGNSVRPPRDIASICDYFAYLMTYEDEGEVLHREMALMLNEPAKFFTPPPEAELRNTPRGFYKIDFTDRYGSECSIQKSSLAGEDCIWFGVDKPSAALRHQTGEGLRMHMTQDSVKKLLPFLKEFAKSGELGG